MEHLRKSWKLWRRSAFLWDEITRNEVEEYSTGDYDDGFFVEEEQASTGSQITHPKFRTEYGTYVSFKQGVWDDDTGS